MDLICDMSRDAVRSLEQLGLATNIGMGVELHSDDEESGQEAAPSIIDLAFRTNDLERCFPPTARILFDSHGASNLADFEVNDNIVIVEEFAPSLRVFNEAADAKITTFKLLLEHNVHFDVIEGPVQGITRKRLHRLDESPAGATKIMVILVVFEGLSNVEIDQYELLKPEACMIGKYTTNLMPPGIRFTIMHIPIRSVYEFAVDLHGQVQRKVALESTKTKSTLKNDESQPSNKL